MRTTIGEQSKRIDETGNVYGKLTVLGYSHTERVQQQDITGGRQIAFWFCKCTCGDCKPVSGKELRRTDERAIRSCGKCKNVTHGHTVKRHSPTYVSWHAMLTRCANRKSKRYGDYGGRGIAVCRRWLAFENFLADMGERPTKRHSIERNNTNGDYEPNNCRWATKREQARNTRVNVRVTVRGETKLLCEWLEQFGMNVQTYYSRLYRGATQEEALTGQSRYELTIDGVTKHINEWLRESEVSYNTYKRRVYNLGWTKERAATTPIT